MLIRPAIGDTDLIRYRRPTPVGQFSGYILRRHGFLLLIAEHDCMTARRRFLDRKGRLKCAYAIYLPQIGVGPLNHQDFRFQGANPP